MNLVEWLIYGAALDRWRYIGGFVMAEDYLACREVVRTGDKLSGYRSLK